MTSTVIIHVQSTPAPTPVEMVPAPTEGIPAPLPVGDSYAQAYSPVAVILATCALVTAIGRVLSPKQ
jgi:hypothetical protein